MQTIFKKWLSGNHTTPQAVIGSVVLWSISAVLMCVVGGGYVPKYAKPCYSAVCISLFKVTGECMHLLHVFSINLKLQWYENFV